MEYYFEVIIDYKPMSHILVKAGDVIEAGYAVIAVLTERGHMVTYNDILEINRTKITKVIE